jgi:hypothetical protein
VRSEELRQVVYIFKCLVRALTEVLWSVA